MVYIYILERWHTLQELDLTQHNPSIFESQNDDLKTAEQVLEQLIQEAEEQGTEWLAENLEVSLQAVKEKRGVR